MTETGVEAWQICILVTAAIVLVEFAINAAVARLKTTPDWSRLRTALLVALAVLSMVVFVVALGPTLADELSSVAATVVAGAALWLTYRSHQTSKANRPADPAVRVEPPRTPTEPPPPAPSSTAPQPSVPQQVASSVEARAVPTPSARRATVAPHIGGQWADWLRSRRKPHRDD